MVQYIHNISNLIDLEADFVDAINAMNGSKSTAGRAVLSSAGLMVECISRPKMVQFYVSSVTDLIFYEGHV